MCLKPQYPEDEDPWVRQKSFFFVASGPLIKHIPFIMKNFEFPSRVCKIEGCFFDGSQAKMFIFT